MAWEDARAAFLGSPVNALGGTLHATRTSTQLLFVTDGNGDLLLNTTFCCNP